MLAKPEYFSPPGEVCCWPGRSGGGAAGRGTVAEVLLAGTPWRRHCWPCAVAERHREDAGRGAVAEVLLAGAPWRSAIGKLLVGAP